MVRVAIYNNYLSTFGGGERSTFTLAAALAHRGFDVEILSFENKVPTDSEIASFFGPGLTGYRVVSLSHLKREGVPTDVVLAEYLDGRYQVFFNHTASSSVLNPCPLGIYMVMFPFQDRGDFVGTYQHFLCNSAFTAAYTRLRWGEVATTVLYPCGEFDEGPVAETREREIVTLGRFNVHGHTKNQGLLVDAFEEMMSIVPSGWRLTMIGRVNDNPETAKYMEKLRARAARLPLQLELNISERRKRDILRRASIFWHGTGLGFQEPRDAIRMEHFGIAVVEAMLAGAIPLCYGRAGPMEILQHGKSGFVYQDTEELKTYTALLMASRQIRERMSAAAVERAKHFDRVAFEQNLERFMAQVVAA